MMTLQRSKDRKVANAVSPNGKSATVANAFGLPAGISCPGATSFCERVCYAKKIERMPYLKSVRTLLHSNFQTLLYADYLDGSEGMYDVIAAMLTDFVKDCDRRNAPKRFRIHWDGDFFNESYAIAWADAVRSFPEIQFWVYTRSFDASVNVLPFITGIPNLTVYLSADPVNIDLANKRAAEYPGTLIATVADTFAEARDTIIDDTRKSYACPENRQTLDLITKKGSACNRCGICIDGRGDVLFSVKKC